MSTNGSPQAKPAVTGSDNKAIIPSTIPGNQVPPNLDSAAADYENPILVSSPDVGPSRCLRKPNDLVPFHPAHTKVCRWSGTSWDDWYAYHRRPHYPVREPECVRTCWICSGFETVCTQRTLDGVSLDYENQKAIWKQQKYATFESKVALKAHIRKAHPGYCGVCQEECGATNEQSIPPEEVRKRK
ncbi:hypothetical protein ABW19_dt0206547 [Dactylella cylindrospora]|nr:hypothetical protein ABW19_dt0206547 [Dactylella cylindrospora]